MLVPLFRFANGRLSALKPRRVWTVEEDEAIRQLVAKFGTKSWSVIAEHIVKDYGIHGRTGKQCRERWHNHLGKRRRGMRMWGRGKSRRLRGEAGDTV